MKKIFLFFLLALVTASCKTKTAATGPKDISAPVQHTDFFDKIESAPQFQQVKINSTVTAETGKFIPPMETTIYIEKDRKIWMNIAVLFNVARGIATPEGIRGYEKWNKTYIESDFTYLNQLLNVNFINYQALQNLLTGRPFIPISENDFTLTTNTESFVLDSKKDQWVTMNGKTVKYSIRMEMAANLDLKHVDIRDTTGQNELQVDYSGWASYGETRFPKSVKIIIKGEKNGQILLENTKFDFNSMETPYSVPSNYTKTEIK